MKVSVTNSGIKIGENEVPLVLGAMHYWRLDHLLWDELLDKVQGMGFNMIETYIPWSVHEVAPGDFDFGERSPRKDIGTFLDLCKKRNIWVIVRPGPHINAEITCFGYPERVLQDPECQSVSAQGTPVYLPVPPKAFPVPSYASGKFYDEVATWFDAVCPIIEKRIFPNGAVIGVQADNEMTLFFRTSAYDHDYSDGAQRLFHEFLEHKYESISELNRVYRSKYRNFEDVPMLYRFDARTREDLPRYMDWACYKEYYIHSALKRIAGMLKERGVTGIPVTHNYASPLQECPFNVSEAEKFLDIQGFDMYPQKRQYDQLKRGCLMSSAQSRLPFIPEFSSGCWIYNPPVTFADQRFTTLTAWMHGIKAISFYMLVERERWYGSPVARDGRIRDPYYSFYKKFNEILKNKELNKLNRVADILLVKPRSYQYLESASTLFEPLTPLFLRLAGVSAEIDCSEEKFGFDQPIPIATEKWYNSWYKALTRAKYAFLLGDTAMVAESFNAYKVMIVPTFEFLGKSEQEKLVEYADNGGTLVVGPKIPELDETMEPCEILKRKLIACGDKGEEMPFLRIYTCGSGKVIHVERQPKGEVEFQKAVDAIAVMAGVKRIFPALDLKLETSFHMSSNRKGVLYVANPTDIRRTAAIKTGGQVRFKDLWNGEEFEGDEMVEFEIEPYTVRMMEVL